MAPTENVTYRFPPPVYELIRKIDLLFSHDNRRYRATIIALRARILPFIETRLNEIREAQIVHSAKPDPQNLKLFFLSFVSLHDIHAEEPTGSEDENKPMNRAGDLKKLLMETENPSRNDYLCDTLNRRIATDMGKHLSRIEMQYQVFGDDTDLLMSVQATDPAALKGDESSYIENPLKLSSATPKEKSIAWQTFLLLNYGFHSASVLKPLDKTPGAKFDPEDFEEVERRHMALLMEAKWAV